jgi:glycosyltransferase involved in cell wall biosynthesis
VISDNASQDNTTQLVEAYKAKYPNIQYFRNIENIGAIRNVL